MGLVLVLVIATDVVPLTVLVVASTVVWRRRHRGRTATVPMVVAALALVVTTWVAVTFLAGVGPLLPGHPMDPATKATILSLGISEAINCATLFLLASVPVLLVARLVDRRLTARPGTTTT